MLIEHVIKDVSREGCLTIELEVEEDHSQAEHLYQRKGFKRLPHSRWVKVL